MPDVVRGVVQVARPISSVEEALRRELARARSERRWVDADGIARELDELQAATSAKVVDLAAARKARA